MSHERVAVAVRLYTLEVLLPDYSIKRSANLSIENRTEYHVS